MAPRSITIQLAPGIAQATLPDHRKMVPGVQYEVDWESFTKISPAARQSFIDVVTVNTNSNGSSTLADQTSNATPQLGIWDILTTVSDEPIYQLEGLNLSGKAFQGWTVKQDIAGADAGGFKKFSITGPQDERYVYIYNGDGATSPAGSVLVWSYGGTSTGWTSQYRWNLDQINYNSGEGVFAGVALVDIPENNYGWIQIEGECAAVEVTGVTTGDPLYPDPETDGTAANSSGVFINTTSIATGAPEVKPFTPFGTALEDIGGGQFTAHLRSFKSKTPYRRVYNKN
jgi:hypothetical protein